MNKLIPAVAIAVVAVYLFSKMLDKAEPRQLNPEYLQTRLFDGIQDVGVKMVNNEINLLIPPSMADSLSMTPSPKAAYYAALNAPPEPVSEAPPAIDLDAIERERAVVAAAERKRVDEENRLIMEEEWRRQDAEVAQKAADRAQKKREQEAEWEQNAKDIKEMQKAQALAIEMNKKSLEDSRRAEALVRSQQDALIEYTRKTVEFNLEERKRLSQMIF